MRLFISSRYRQNKLRRGLPVAMALGLACLFLLAGCSLPWQHGTGDGGLGPKPSAQQILTTMQKNFAAVHSFHLTMKTDKLGNTDSSQLVIRDADGDVLMPDKLRAQASVLLSGQPVTVNLVSVGAQQYITDPITGQWRVVTGALDPRTLTNPQTGIIALTGKLQNVTGPTDDTVNGTACWRVNGQLPAQDVAALLGGDAPAGTMLKTSICAGKSDGLPYEVAVTGEAAAGDTPQTTRTFFISKYNENISIVAPQV